MTNNNSQKGFAMPIIIAIIALVVLAAGVGYYATRKQPQTTQSPASEKTLEDGATMAKYTGTILAGKSAPLIDYNKADYDAAIASDKLVVLYFYANWCPICKEEVANALYPAFNELTTDKVVGIRINYNDSDTDSNEKALASQFGVAYQHTKVFVKNGQRILKSPEGWDEKRYDMEINKALGQ